MVHASAGLPFIVYFSIYRKPDDGPLGPKHVAYLKRNVALQ